ncbi:MAG: TolC family protein [Bacteroidota bacterium]
MLIRSYIFTLPLLTALVFPGFGQPGILETYIETGLQNNQQLIREQLDVEIQREVLREAKGKFLPDIFVDASYIRADGGRIIAVPAGDLVNPAYAGLNQLFGSEQFPANIENVNEQFLPDNFHETKIRLIQPILNTDIYFNRRIQQSQLSAREARQKAFENQLINRIKEAYYNHLSAKEQLAILSATRSILLELVRVSKSQVANDKATKEVIFGAQAELSQLESEIAGAERQEKVSGIFFNYLIGRDLNDSILVEEEEVLETSQPQRLADLTNTALNQRQEISEINFGLEASQSRTLLNKRYVVPEISLVGDLGFQGFGYEFDDTQDFWFLSVGLTWPIFQGHQNKARIQQAVLQEKQLTSRLKETQDLIALEVAEAYYAYEEALKTMEARRAERESAQENFRIIEKKYAQNQVIQVAFNEARNTYTTAQLQEVITKYKVKIRKAALDAAIAHQKI